MLVHSARLSLFKWKLVFYHIELKQIPFGMIARPQIQTRDGLVLSWNASSVLSCHLPIVHWELVF